MMGFLRVLTRFSSYLSLEEAILSPTQHPVLVQILTRFVLNLKPGARNLRYSLQNMTFKENLAYLSLF